MNTHTNLLEKFNQYLQLNRFSKAPESLYAPIDYIMQMGGKRFRPLLVLMAYKLWHDEVEKALPAALAVELFHNFSLVHDDIMDEAPLRRGNPSVHIKYGLNAGILSGDVMLIYVYALLQQLEIGGKNNELIGHFNEVAIKVCEGQQYDIDFEAQQQVSIPGYIKMIEYKTAVLMGGALRMGALIAGAPETDQHHLNEFGRQIGIAFQIQDDLLDTFGDPAKFGKKVGGDIVQNKKTFLVLKALELAEQPTQDRLIHLLNTETEDEKAKIDEVTALFNQLDIRDHTLKAMESYLDKGFEHLRQVSVLPERKALLETTAKSFVSREV